MSKYPYRQNREEIKALLNNLTTSKPVKPTLFLRKIPLSVLLIISMKTSN